MSSTQIRPYICPFSGVHFTDKAPRECFAEYYAFSDEGNAGGFSNSKAQRERFAEYCDFSTTNTSIRDEETGFGYFGARYMDHELMTMWLSVDPMADKYPGISPYAYCAWTRPTGGDEHRWIKYNIVNNPIKLVDPDGNDWYKAADGNINYTTNYSSSMGRYLGKTVQDGSTYYSLFGQKINMKDNKSRRNAEITMKIDQQMILYAKYLKEENNYKLSLYDQGGPSHSFTDFKIPSVVFDGSWRTTHQNQYGPNEMGTYAGMADIYYYVNGGGGNGTAMKARFDCWIGTTCVTGRNGNFSTPTSQGGNGNLQHPYLTFKNGNNVIVALNFHTDNQKQLFKNKFYALFLKASLVLNKILTKVVACILFTGFIHVNANAQYNDTICLQKKIGHNLQSKSLNDEIDDMLMFFFYAQEAYFSSHFTYSNDVETVLRYGENISPILYHQIMDSITHFRVEGGVSEMRLFHNNDTLVTYRQSINCQDFCREGHLRHYVWVFDDKDLVIHDENIFMEYFAQKRDLLVNLHEKYGFDVETVMLPVDECDINVREYPLTVLFVYDSNGLIVHPIFDECKYHIDNDYNHYLAQMADLLCSKYNASKIIFTSQIMYRK